MKYAKKINFQMKPPEIKKNLVLGEYGQLEDEENASVTRLYVPKKYVSEIKSRLPQQLLEKIVFINYAEIRVSGPHIHLSEQSVINYYIQTNGEITAFYEGEARVDHSVVVDSGNDYYPIAEDSVTEVEHFIAEPGDVWLMSTRQPHSIYCAGITATGREKYRHTEGKFRKVVQIYMDAQFDYVSSFFEAV
jgi:hypothetical protein